jgi:hypothetical protein
LLFEQDREWGLKPRPRTNSKGRPRDQSAYWSPCLFGKPGVEAQPSGGLGFPNSASGGVVFVAVENVRHAFAQSLLDLAGHHFHDVVGRALKKSGY